MLRDAEQISHHMQRMAVPVPWWYFPGLAAAISALALVQMLPSLAMVGATIVIAAGIGAIVAAGPQQAGFMPRVNWVAALPLMLLVMAMWIAAIVLHRRYDLPWVWYIVAGISGGMVLAFGLYYRRYLQNASS